MSDSKSPGFKRSSHPAATSIETEAKFVVHETKDSVMERLRALACAAGFEFVVKGGVELLDRYWDTTGLRLAASGWTYRWRRRYRSANREVSLKAIGPPGEDAHLQREQIDEVVAGFPPCPMEAPGQIAERLRDLLGDGAQEFEEIFGIASLRTIFKLTRGEELIEMTLDEARVCDPPDAAGKTLACEPLRFTELRLKLVEGSDVAIRELARRIGSDLGLVPTRMNDFSRGLFACNGRSRNLPQCFQPRKLRPLPGVADAKHGPVTALLSAYFVERFHDLLLFEDVAWEGFSLEGVHRMRVSVRKFIALWDRFHDQFDFPVSKGESRKFRADLKWLAKRLGEVRDLDVFLIEMQGHERELPSSVLPDLEPYRCDIQRRWHQARRELLAALSSRRYAGLKARIEKVLGGFADGAEARDGREGSRAKGKGNAKGNAKGKGKRRKKTELERLGELLIESLRRFRAMAGEIDPATGGEPLHELRKRSKQLRYLFEFSVPLIGPRAGRMAKALESLQESLGAYQDACVALERLEEFTASHPVNALGLHMLRAFLLYRQEDARRKSFTAWHGDLSRRLSPKKLAAAIGERAAEPLGSATLRPISP